MGWRETGCTTSRRSRSAECPPRLGCESLSKHCLTSRSAECPPRLGWECLLQQVTTNRSAECRQNWDVSVFSNMLQRTFELLYLLSHGARPLSRCFGFRSGWSHLEFMIRSGTTFVSVFASVVGLASDQYLVAGRK